MTTRRITITVDFDRNPTVGMTVATLRRMILRAMYLRLCDERDGQQTPVNISRIHISKITPHDDDDGKIYEF